MNWQPIATAPKDRRILLYYPEKLFNEIHCVFGKWEHEKNHSRPKPYWTNDLVGLSGVVSTKKNQPTLWAEVEMPVQYHVHPQNRGKELRE